MKKNTKDEKQAKTVRQEVNDDMEPSVVPEGKVRTSLIFGTIAVFAAIVFGLLYIFVISPTAPTEGAGWSTGWFLFSFAAGLTMIVLPCTLPLAFVIVPLSMGKGLLRGISMALAFGLGVTVTLSIYGILAALLGGAAIDTLGADIEVVKNWVYFVAGIFALIFALSEIGLMNIHMPTYSGAAPAFIQKKQEILKAFLLGLFLGNIGVGCPHPATPLILIEIATSGDVLYGWLMFLVHAIGRVLPLLLLAFLAILGVNGLNWLMSRKDVVERVTGWAMVFVAGFILTLGLFTHDWWVNSGIHTQLEAVTQESKFNAIFNRNLETDVEHVHGLEEGAGLFGQPLDWGHWFLVLVWLIPIWFWYYKRKRDLKGSPDPCEDKILQTKRNFLILISIFLVLIFVYFLPNNFYYKSTGGADHDDHGMADEHAQGANQSLDGIHMMDGMIMNSAGEMIEGASMMPDGTIMLADGTTVENDQGAMQPIGEPFIHSTIDLPEATQPETVVLEDGDTYDITAYYVQKEVGNRNLRMLSYNGSVPGPFIRANQGAEVTINFTNNTDIDLTIHSHGIRVDNRFDGVPGATQDPVAPGETFRYTIDFADGGVYWYHPHTRDDYGQELGLYGNYLVEPSDGYQSPVNREVPLVIDDILIENDRIANFYKNTTNFALLGRFGNEYLVNGEENYTLTAKTGEVIRFFITNVSNARSYNLSIPGAEMKLVGADVGQYERQEYISDFLISPAERVIVEAYFDEAGTYSLTHTIPGGEKTELTRFLVTDDNAAPSHVEAFKTLQSNQAVIDEFANFRSYRDTAPDKRLLLTVDIESQIDHSAHAHNDGASGGVDHSQHAHMHEGDSRLAGLQWNDPGASDESNTIDTITWKLIDQDTGRESMDIPIEDWTFKQGELVKIRLTNDANADHVMQHPIHLHGQRFVVLSENGEPNENLVWKDTVLVFPAETVDILVEMSNPGEWMNHCHISEHLHAGMMMTFRVENENGNAPGDVYRASSTDSSPHNTQNTEPAKNKNEQLSTGSGEVPTQFEHYSFDTKVPATNYEVHLVNERLQANTLEEITFTVFDESGDSIQLSSTAPTPLTVTFVSSNDTDKTFTYPGNTAFDEFIPTHGDPGHDNSDGHHDTPTADDGHDHIHMNKDKRSFALVSRAHAHGGTADEHSDAEGQTFSYTMPVVFPDQGFYRAFVEFIPEGETDKQVVALDIKVASDSFSIDNFGWSDTSRWLILFVASIILASLLSLFVYRFVVIKELYGE